MKSKFVFLTAFAILSSANLFGSSILVGEGNGNSIRYLVPDALTGNTWNLQSYDDALWIQSSGTSIGFDSDLAGPTSFIPFFSIDVASGFRNINTSIYTRYSFHVVNKSVFESLALNIRYEDGFIAYLNGIEIARGNFTGTPAYNSGTAARNEALAIIPESFSLGLAGLSALQNGNNILAIQGINASAGSNDFMLSPTLEATVFVPEANQFMIPSLLALFYLTRRKRA